MLKVPVVITFHVNKSKYMINKQRNKMVGPTLPIYLMCANRTTFLFYIISKFTEEKVKLSPTDSPEFFLVEFIFSSYMSSSHDLNIHVK